MLGTELASWAVVVVLMAGLLGGVAQSSLGFGAAFAVVPALAFTAPELLPGAVLVAVLPLSVLMVVRDHRGVDLSAVGRLSIGRLPGIVTGAAVVAVLPTRALAATIAVLLLLAVAASVGGFEVVVTPRREVGAGYISGLTGTAAGLGGPPLALLYQGRRGSVLRPTLAAVWALGIVPSLGSLAIAGEFTAVQFRAGVTLSVMMLLGMAGGVAVVRYLPEHRLREAVLWWAAVGGLLALGRSIAG